MPLLQIDQLDPHTLLGIWQTNESLEELKQLLPAHVDASQIAQVHEKRKKEWLASRLLVYTLLPRFTDVPIALQRDEKGKPYFKDQALHISISHSSQMAAVILSDKYEVGIDIELVSPKALRVAHKFLGDSEKELTNQNEKLTCLYWSAKETLYKLYGRKQLIFKDNLIINAGHEQNLLKGQIKVANFSKLYQIHCKDLDNHILTYCIDSIRS